MTHRHFILYKPYGYISQLVDNSCKRNGLLGELYDFPQGVMAVGRLDKDSEGLLLLTTDGKLSNFIRGNHIEKQYVVQVDGDIDLETIQRLRDGVEIYTEGEYYSTAPCIVEKLEQVPNFPERKKRVRDERHGPTSWISITIREGRNRQVRKMTGIVGFPTLRLVRVRIASVSLAGLQVGEVQEIADFGEDIKRAYAALEQLKN